MQFHLGRETPYSLNVIDQNLIVFYRDAICKYAPADGFQTVAEALVTTEAAAVLPTSEIVVGSGPGLRFFDQNLQPVEQVDRAQEDDIVDLLSLSKDSFLSIDEGGTIVAWSRDGEHHFTPGVCWPVECVPLFGLNSGKTVVCAERGRLQERDPKNGMMIRSWPKTAQAAWGVAESHGYNALIVSEDGAGWIWDLSSREALFALSLDFSAVRGAFREDGTSGAVLGQDGEVATFKIVGGGETSRVCAPDTPLVSLTFLQNALFGVDENGGLWELGEDTPRLVGGTWAGWATCSLFRAPDQVFVGTATGSLERFQSQGKRAAPAIQLHQDAVVGLELWDGSILSVGADATVKRVEQLETEEPTVHTIAEYPGHSVVGHALCAQSGWLWLGLEDGLVAWLSPSGEQGSLQLDGRRVEELQSAGVGQALVLTDRGSVLCLQADQAR